MNTFHPPITTGIVSHSIERQTLLLPKINMVSLGLPFMSFNFPKFKDHKQQIKKLSLQTDFVCPKPKTVIPSDLASILKTAILNYLCCVFIFITGINLSHVATLISTIFTIGAIPIISYNS